MRNTTEKLCLVVPCYNESLRLDFNKFSEVQRILNCSFLFIDDGSTDDTKSKIQQFCESSRSFCFLSLPKNVGKSKAIYQGLRFAKSQKYEIFGTYDADSAVGVNDYARALNHIRENPMIDLVSGARILLAGSTIKRGKIRRWMSRVVATYINLIIDQDFYDPQSPCKLFRHSYFEDCSEPRTRWFFDIEIILHRKMSVNFHLKNSISVLEFPLESWIDVEQSKIRKNQYLKILKDIMILSKLRLFP